MNSAALHAEALASGNPCDCHACAPVLDRGAILTPDELAIFLDAITETQALWLAQPRNRPLYARNLVYYHRRLADHFEAVAVAEGGGA